MSALPPKPDIVERDRHVRFVPKADIGAWVLESTLVTHEVGLERQMRVWPNVG